MIKFRSDVRFYSQIWTIFLGFRLFWLDLGHTVWIWAPKEIKPWGMGGRMYRCTYGQMDRFPLYSTGLRPLWGRCPKNLLRPLIILFWLQICPLSPQFMDGWTGRFPATPTQIHNHEKQGKGYCWPHIALERLVWPEEQFWGQASGLRPKGQIWGIESWFEAWRSWEQIWGLESWFEDKISFITL